LGSAAVGLVERERELARVDREFDRVIAGVGLAVVVEGPAGIGKSDLLAAVRAGAAARGFGVLSARGSEFEAGMAFGVARQLFEPLVRAASAGERRELLDGVARVGARALGVEDGEPPADRFAAIHGLFWLCANRAERGPVVVVVDDVQWVDDPSLGWLGYVARRVEELPVALVLGLRTGDVGAERPELVSLAEGARERIVLAPLTERAVGAIVRGQLDAGADAEFCRGCFELTGGNPLFVRELLAAAGEEGLVARAESVDALRRIAPSAVGASVLARLGRLGVEAVALARAVAVLGPGVEVTLAARLAELDPTVAELTADRLAAAQIFAPVRPLEFFHPLIHSAVEKDIGAGARRIAHRRAATLLDENGGGSLARVAAHLVACGPAEDPWVAGRLGDAAREALERGAPEIAVEFLRRALSEPPPRSERGALLFLLGTAEWRAGRADAIPHLEQAIGDAGSDSRTLIAACALLTLAYVESDRAERAVEVLRGAAAAVGEQTATLAVTEGLGGVEPLPFRDVSLGVVIEASIAAVGKMDERTAPGAWRLAEGLRGRLGTLPDAPVHLLAMLALHAAQSNRAAEAEELAQRALACEPYPPPLDVCTLLIHALRMIERPDLLQALCEDLLAAARRRGAIRETIGILVSRATASYEFGGLADAEADARWAMEHADGRRRLHAVSELIHVLVERDALDEAGSLVGQFPDPRSSRSIDVPRVLIARGRLRAAEGRLEEARDDFLECGERCTRLGLRGFSTPWRAEAAVVGVTLGDAQQSRELAGEQLELARAFGRPRMLGISLRACGLVESEQKGLLFLADAVRTLESSQSPLELARALCDHGAALRRAGRRVQARVELERALDLAHRLGARRIASRARSELIAAGAKPRRDAITGRDALTDAELRVARLAADDLTNRQIAQALFITTTTAKTHLGRVYRKLDITGRDELKQALSGPLTETSRS
jgi:DNA-binding CsgD family transcriptional regulator